MTNYSTKAPSTPNAPNNITGTDTLAGMNDLDVMYDTVDNEEMLVEGEGERDNGQYNQASWNVYI